MALKRLLLPAMIRALLLVGSSCTKGFSRAKSRRSRWKLGRVSMSVELKVERGPVCATRGPALEARTTTSALPASAAAAGVRSSW